jgi:hypothetical protein
MNALAINPKTGFLEANNRSSFKSEDKTKLIQLAQECVDRKEAPRLKAICDRVGITTVTFWAHIDQDPEFKTMWDEIRFQVEDLLENSLVNLGQKANGVGAAAFWLKNKVPERWSDNPGINQTNLDISWLKKLVEVFKPPAISTEAEITSTPKAIDASPSDDK